MAISQIALLYPIKPSHDNAMDIPALKGIHPIGERSLAAGIWKSGTALNGRILRERLIEMDPYPNG